MKTITVPIFIFFSIGLLLNLAMMNSAQGQTNHILQSLEETLLTDGPTATAMKNKNCSHIKSLFPLIENQDALSLRELDTKLKRNSFVEKLFALRLEIRRKLGHFAERSSIPPDCIHSMRRLFSSLRYLEEVLDEANMVPSNDQKDLPVFMGGRPYYRSLRPESDRQLRSGDILLSRSSSPVSAGIARIGGDEGQFSHLALVYHDEKTQQWYTIESHISHGAVAEPLIKYLFDGKVRASIFRHPNAQLASLAAQIMYDKVTQASQSPSGNLPYDFGMNLKTPNKLFCAEVAWFGYTLAAKKLGISNFDMPLFKTSLKLNNRSFVDSIGIEVDEIFTPNDIDIDPRFELIAEWRDLNKTREARTLDLILSAMFSWMENADYNFDQTLADDLAISLSWLSRQSKLFAPLLEDYFPPHFKIDGLAATVSMMEVAYALYDDLQTYNKRFQDLAGVMLLPGQIKEMLELIRSADQARFLNRHESKDSTLFHHRFHPPEKRLLDGVLYLPEYF